MTYKPWKGFTLWLGGTAIFALIFGFGENDAIACLMLFLATWVWSISELGEPK